MRRRDRELAGTRQTAPRGEEAQPDDERDDHEHAEPDHAEVELDSPVELGGARDADRHEGRDRDRDDERDDRGDQRGEQAPHPCEHVELGPLHAERGEHGVVTRLGVRLSHQTLGNDEQQRDQDEQRDEPQRDHLRVDRGLDLRLLERTAHDETDRRAFPQTLDALRERVEE